MGLLKLVLDCGADPDALRIHSTERRQSTQSTPLYEAVIASEKYLVEMLLSHGAAPMRECSLRAILRLCPLNTLPASSNAQVRAYAKWCLPTRCCWT